MYKVGMGHKPPIPEKLSTEGKDFLGHCLESEPKRRWTASMLLDHPFVKVSRFISDLSKRMNRPFRKKEVSVLKLLFCCPPPPFFRFVLMKSEQTLHCVFLGLQM